MHRFAVFDTANAENKANELVVVECTGSDTADFLADLENGGGNGLREGFTPRLPLQGDAGRKLGRLAQLANFDAQKVSKMRVNRASR